MCQSRKLYLDIAKGIAIILMVIGHTSIHIAASNFIYAFHMPLFFMASGFTSNYRKHSPMDYIFHKASAILLPFAVYSVIVACLLHYLLGNDVISLLSNGWGGYALWFIPVLYLASILAMLVSLAESTYLRYLLMLCLIAFGCWLSYYNISLPWALSTVPYAAFLILVGAELKRFQKWIEASSHYWDIVLLLSATAVISQFHRLDMAWNHITPVIPLTIGAITGTLSVFRVSVLIERSIKWCASLLQKIGRETYIVVAFSQITILCINHFFAINPILKYTLLVVVLILLKYTKDAINRMAKIKIL